jgi:hypothetical protein
MSAGLCQTCAYRKAVPNTRGSVFTLCLRSKSDPAYPRYPRLPVERCLGHEVGSPTGPAGAGADAGAQLPTLGDCNSSTGLDCDSGISVES